MASRSEPPADHEPTRLGQLVGRPTPLLQVDELQVRFPSRHGWISVVRGASFTVAAGECLAILGESGCGKSVTCAAILSLLPSHAQIGGRIAFGGSDLLTLPERALRRVRGAKIAMVFQDPMAAINPVRRIGSQIADKLMAHADIGRSAALREAERLLDQVRVPAAHTRLRDYPSQLSGGLCQRVMIAIALACGPNLLIADEPTTALDVTIQAQILDLFDELRRELGMALILVTHDIGVVARAADRVAVMYAGQIVEEGPMAEALERPRHPYTRALLAASPQLDTPPLTQLNAIPGIVPSLADLPPGCAYAPRCPRAAAVCTSATPTFRRIGEAAVACFDPQDEHV